MLFYFEFHRLSRPRVHITGGQCLITLFFITLGGVAKTMDEIQNMAAAVALNNLQHIIQRHGVEGLDSLVHDAISDSRETDR